MAVAGSNIARLMIGVGLALLAWASYESGFFGAIRTREAVSPTLATFYMHESFKVGYWEYSVNRAVRSRWLGRGMSAQKTTGEFIVVFMTATNNDSSASTLPFPVLKDRRQREYSARPTFGVGIRGEDLSIVTLNPGVSRQGYFVFEVPQDTSTLQVVLSGGLRSNQTAIVPLELDQLRVNSDLDSNDL